MKCTLARSVCKTPIEMIMFERFCESSRRLDQRMINLVAIVVINMENSRLMKIFGFRSILQCSIQQILLERVFQLFGFHHNDWIHGGSSMLAVDNSSLMKFIQSWSLYCVCVCVLYELSTDDEKKIDTSRIFW